MASANHMKASRQTYESFISLVKIGTPVVMGIAALVIFLLTH